MVPRVPPRLKLNSIHGHTLFTTWRNFTRKFFFFVEKIVHCAFWYRGRPLLVLYFDVLHLYVDLVCSLVSWDSHTSMHLDEPDLLSYWRDMHYVWDNHLSVLRSKSVSRNAPTFWRKSQSSYNETSFNWIMSTEP